MSKKRHTKMAQTKAIRDNESGQSKEGICKELKQTLVDGLLQERILEIVVENSEAGGAAVASRP